MWATVSYWHPTQWEQVTFNGVAYALRRCSYLSIRFKNFVSWRKRVGLRGHDNRNFSWIVGYFELWRNEHVSLQAAGGGSDPPSSSNDDPSPTVPRGMAIHSSEQLLLQSKCLTSECKQLSLQIRICFMYAWKVDFTSPTWYGVCGDMSPAIARWCEGEVQESAVCRLNWIWSHWDLEMTGKPKLQ